MIINNYYKGLTVQPLLGNSPKISRGFSWLYRVFPYWRIDLLMIQWWYTVMLKIGSRNITQGRFCRDFYLQNPKLNSDKGDEKGYVYTGDQ